MKPNPPSHAFPQVHVTEPIPIPENVTDLNAPSGPPTRPAAGSSPRSALKPQSPVAPSGLGGMADRFKALMHLKKKTPTRVKFHENVAVARYPSSCEMALLCSVYGRLTGFEPTPEEIADIRKKFYEASPDTTVPIHCEDHVARKIHVVEGVRPAEQEPGASSPTAGLTLDTAELWIKDAFPDLA